jgi:hypothetical protein
MNFNMFMRYGMLFISSVMLGYGIYACTVTCFK